jgi:hypothetical protein
MLIEITIERNFLSIEYQWWRCSLKTIIASWWCIQIKHYRRHLFSTIEQKVMANIHTTFWCQKESIGLSLVFAYVVTSLHTCVYGRQRISSMDRPCIGVCWMVDRHDMPFEVENKDDETEQPWPITIKETNSNRAIARKNREVDIGRIFYLSKSILSRERQETRRMS